MCATAWDTSVAFYRWWASWIDRPWILVAIGVVLTVAAFVLAHVHLSPDREDDDPVVPLPTDGWCLLGLSLMFMVIYFNDFALWSQVDGFAGLFAWLGALSFLLWMGGFSLFVLMYLYFILDSLFRGLSDLTGRYLLMVGQQLLCLALLLAGMLLMSSVTGPVCAAVFFVAALFWPSSNKIGTFEDRHGRIWEVWRN